MSPDAFEKLIRNLSLASISSIRADILRDPQGQNAHLKSVADARIAELTALEPTPDYGPVSPIWHSFCDEVNAKGLSVLEIGARVGPDETPAKRSIFHGASQYVGFDFHEGPNVDIIGDVHDLSRLLGGRKFDAICSFSVLEHVAMPWLAALEMVKVLNVGGIMFHHVPFGWPMHELPWDFWRFTPETYRVLFPEQFGMTVEKAGAEFPLRMVMDNTHPDQQSFHLARSYGFTGAVLRKIAEMDLNRFQWTLSVAELLGADSVYPTRSVEP